MSLSLAMRNLKALLNPKVALEHFCEAIVKVVAKAPKLSKLKNIMALAVHDLLALEKKVLPNIGGIPQCLQRFSHALILLKHQRDLVAHVRELHLPQTIDRSKQKKA